MRVATWNLAGRWSAAHRELLLGLDADVLLLTEVPDALDLPDHAVHRTRALMAEGRAWSAVAARTRLDPLPDPHPATAVAATEGRTFASSVLPWRSCGSDPWGDGSHADRTERVVGVLVKRLPRTGLVWGGDWNHALSGREYAGSAAGRRTVLDAVDTLGLTVVTADLPHRLAGLLSIDHLALPAGSTASATRVDATGLSDHDAYVADVAS